MKLTFNRSQTIEVKIKKPGTSRAFVFDLEIAVARGSEPQVDPLSGMLLNLVDVDAILAELHNTLSGGAAGEGKTALEASSFQSLLEKSHDFTAAKLKSKGCVLNEICFREKRGFSFGWKTGMLFMGHTETREWAGGVCRFESERSFDESSLESQKLNMASTTAELLKANPHLKSLIIENLGTGEKNLCCP
jgi:hypothetical protein